MKRRNILLGASAVTAATVTGGYIWVGKNGESPSFKEKLNTKESQLAQLIRERLPMLRLPATTLAAFVVDHTREHGEFTSSRVRSKLVQKFLLSTDFFPAADEMKELLYVSYHDPYLTPCRNPFRRT